MPRRRGRCIAPRAATAARRRTFIERSTTADIDSRAGADPNTLVIPDLIRDPVPPVGSNGSRIKSGMTKIPRRPLPGPSFTDRTSVVEGKIVAVRLNLGGRRFIKTKKEHDNETKYYI